MIKLEFTEEDKRLLSYGRFNHPHPRVQLKMEVLWLKSQGLSHQKNCSIRMSFSKYGDKLYP